MQDPHLFHETIRENLRYARARRDRRRDRRPRCRAARIHDLIAVAARRLRHDRRRTRLPALRRREAAGRDRARAAQGPGDRHPRRSHVAPRLRVGARDPAGARRGARRPHRDRDRTPAVDDRPRRSHPRDRRRPHRRGGHPRRPPAAGGLYADLYRTQTTGAPRPTWSPAPADADAPSTRDDPHHADDCSTPFDHRPRAASRVAAAAGAGASGQLTASLVIVVVAAFGLGSPTPSARWPIRSPRLATGNAATSTTAGPATAHDEPKCREPSPSTDPLRLWIGGDSLAGSLGPSLGKMTAATGVVAPQFDSRVSTRAHDARRSSTGPSTRPRRWTGSRPRRSCSSSTPTNANDDAERSSDDRPGGDGRTTTTQQVEEMMQILVGAHRTHRLLGRRADHEGAKTGRRTSEPDQVAAAGCVARHPEVTYIDVDHALHRRSTASTSPTITGRRRQVGAAARRRRDPPHARRR